MKSTECEGTAIRIMIGLSLRRAGAVISVTMFVAVGIKSSDIKTHQAENAPDHATLMAAP